MESRKFQYFLQAVEFIFIKECKRLNLFISSHFSTATWYKTLILVFREHGVRKGLYRGLSVNYIKVTPMVAVSFSTYELMRQYLNLDTSKHHR